jgi:CBS domain-containing protein
MSTTAKRSALTGVSVADVMSPGVLACPSDTTLRTVAAMMIAHQVHAVVLSDGPSGEPAVVTDLDLVATAGSIDAPAARASSRPATVAPDDPLVAAADALDRAGRSHVLVLAPGTAHPVGVLSTLDVAAALAGRDARAVRTLRPRPARPAISTSRLERVAVADAMHPGVFACPPDAGLREIATVLVDRRVHCVAVAGTPAPASWKFVTDMSVARAAAAGDEGVRAADLLAEAVWIARDATLDAAAALMVRHGTSHLLVLGERRPAGVLSTLDVIDVLAVAD